MGVPAMVGSSASCRRGRLAESRPPSQPPSTTYLANQSIMYECSICNKEITDKHYSPLCHLQSDTNHWVHKKCTKTAVKDYHPAWKCTLHTSTTTTSLAASIPINIIPSHNSNPTRQSK